MALTNPAQRRPVALAKRSTLPAQASLSVQVIRTRSSRLFYKSVIRRIMEGENVRQISTEMGVSERTIRAFLTLQPRFFARLAATERLPFSVEDIKKGQRRHRGPMTLRSFLEKLKTERWQAEHAGVRAENRKRAFMMLASGRRREEVEREVGINTTTLENWTRVTPAQIKKIHGAATIGGINQAIARQLRKSQGLAARHKITKSVDIMEYDAPIGLVISYLFGQTRKAPKRRKS